MMTTADDFSLPKVGAAITALARCVAPRQANEAEVDTTSLSPQNALPSSEKTPPITSGVGSAFDQLLNAEIAFYHNVRKHLAGIAAGLDVPPADIAELVGECWLKAVEHRHQWEGADLKRRLVCWLRKVVRRKALNLKHHRRLHPIESLNAEELDLIDTLGMKRAEAVEQEEWLSALLAKGRVGHEENHHLVREHYLRQRSVQELAAALGTSENAIDCRIRRHLAYLRGLAE